LPLGRRFCRLSTRSELGLRSVLRNSEVAETLEERFQISTVFVVTRRLDPRQEAPDHVDNVEQDGGPVRVELQDAIAQFAEQVLGFVRHLFEAAKAKEPCGPFDRMDSAEDAP
jgi:hypothetical protein